MPFVYAYEVFENTTHPFNSFATQLWNVSTVSLVVASMKTAFEGTLTYFIESEGGYLICVDTMTGVEKWRYKTGHNVVSDFVVIDDQYLFFGATNGHTSLLRIGQTPSTAPSQAPSTVPSASFSMIPSKLPTEFPSTSPSISASSTPSNLPSDAPSIYSTPSGTSFPTYGHTNPPSSDSSSNINKSENVEVISQASQNHHYGFCFIIATAVTMMLI